MANIVSRFFDRVTGTAEKEEKLKRQEERMQREMRPLQQKAMQRNVLKFQSGQVDRPTYEKRRDNILGNGQQLRTEPERLTGFDALNLALANKVSENNIARPVLTGIARGLSPTTYAGEIAGYAGRVGQAFGWDDGKFLAEAGDKVSGYSKADPQGEFRNKGFGDTLIHGGIELAGDLVYGAATAGVAPLAKYYTSGANSLASEMEAQGYTPQQSLAGGSALGLVNAGLERTGFNKITGNWGKRALSDVAQKGIKNVTTRLVNSGLTESATEGAQTFAENAFRNRLVDSNQGLLDGVAQSALAGGILGAGARGGVEVTNRYSGDQGKQQLQQDVTTVKSTKPLGASSAEVKSDKQFQTLQKRIDTALKNASETTGDVKRNFLSEANELRRLRNARVAELTQGGYVKNPFGEQPKRSQLSGKQLDIPNESLRPSNQETGALLRQTDEDINQFTNQDAEQGVDYDGLVVFPNSKNTKQLEASIAEDNQITQATRQAQLEGSEFNYFAKKDASGRGVGIERFDPKTHRIESGFVLDKDGKILGNHIKVDPTGVEVNVGGQMVNMTDVIGDYKNIQNSYRVSETMERNIRRVFKDKAQSSKVYKYVIANKLQNETNFRKELKAERDALAGRTKAVMKSKPSNVSSKQFKSDIFDYIEGKLSQSKLKDKYSPETIKQINAYKKTTRKLYDSLLDRVNDTFARFGEEQVPRRKDYLTHINELQSKPNFAGEMYGRLRNSALGEADGNTRGGVPAEISGRTGEFEPRKRWNRFFQQRKGDLNYEKDPFVAVDTYLEPTLYNIHMTESAVRARSVESAIRTAQKFEQEFDPKTVKKELVDAFKDRYKDTNLDKVVNGWQEYANALAGKTQAWDRAIIDKGGDTGATALRGWQGLQRIGGRATILGNAQSVLSQTLGIPSTIADAGLLNTLKGIKNMASDKGAIEKSRFVQSRITNVESPLRSNAQKSLDALGVPLQAVEQQFVKATWWAEYNKAKQMGFKGDEAIVEADRLTERVVAGRGIADKPEAYRSTAANGLLQYTLEVNAQNQKFWKDFDSKQKAKYIAGAFMMNQLMQAVTGFEPLPDFLGAAIDSIEDFAEDDERGIEKKIGGTVQRFASEATNMNPFAMAAANQLPQSVRKNIFGEDSDVGRFDGQAAPIKVVERGVGGTKNLLEGKWGQSASEFTRGFVPAGNQINKTAQGVAMNQRGYALDLSGNPTFPAPDTKLGQAQSVVFGPYSTKNARTYFDENQSRITSESDLASIRQSSDPRQTVKVIQQRRSDKRLADGVIPIADSTSRDSNGDYTSYDKYDAVIKAYSKDDGELKNLQKLDNNELKQAIKDVSKEGKRVFEDAGLPFFDNMKADSKFARDYASFRKSIKDVDEITKQKKTQSFVKDTYKSQYLGDGKLKSFYTLSDDDMRYELQQGTLNQEEMDKIIALDNLLTSEGLQPYMQVGKTLRRELGYGVVDSGTGKSSYAGRAKSKSGSKGKKTALKLDLTDYINKSTVPTTQNRYTGSRPRGATYRPVQLRSYSANSGTIPTAPRISVRRAIA